MKRITVLMIVVLGVITFGMQGCVTTPIRPPQEIVLTVKAVDQPVEVAEENEEDKDVVAKSMSVKNPNLELSQCKIHGDAAYVTIDVMAWADEYWQDFKLLRDMGIKRLYVYLNSPGGSSAEGFAITDELRLLRESGVEIIMQGRGNIASAAIPVFLQGTERICTSTTVFLIHPSAIVKWGLFFETLKDIEAQAEMMKINRANYAGAVASRSGLSVDELLEMLEKDTWFTAEKAKDWGLVDRIE